MRLTLRSRQPCPPYKDCYGPGKEKRRTSVAVSEQASLESRRDRYRLTRESITRHRPMHRRCPESGRRGERPRRAPAPRARAQWRNRRRPFGEAAASGDLACRRGEIQGIERSRAITFASLDAALAHPGGALPPLVARAPSRVPSHMFAKSPVCPEAARYEERTGPRHFVCVDLVA